MRQAAVGAIGVKIHARLIGMRMRLGFYRRRHVFRRRLHDLHMARAAKAIKPIIGLVPPDPSSMSWRDLGGLLKLGRYGASLSERERYRTQMESYRAALGGRSS